MTLKFLSSYDSTIYNHLEKAKESQLTSSTKVGGKRGAKGRGSKISFLSNDSQNNLIKIIGGEICERIVNMIKNGKAWALIADTTPDISHHEQLSICVRVVDSSGECSEHLLFCKKATGTTAQHLYDIILDAMKSKGVSFLNLVAQSYDGASNMSGCYGGLQALVKQRFGEHVVFVHCYAHCLNLVLSDTASAAIDVISLFGSLEKLYVLFSRSVKAHLVFETDQRSHNLTVMSLKRINTVRWSSRERSLRVFLQRFQSIQRALTQIASDTSFENNQRDVANGLLETFNKKDILATACLFREIFSVTGPLSLYLQTIDIDLGKAIHIDRFFCKPTAEIASEDR